MVSYIILFTATPFLIIEKIKTPTYEGYKPLKYIAIIFGAICFLSSVFYIKDGSSILFLVSGIDIISRSCYTKELNTRKTY